MRPPQLFQALLECSQRKTQLNHRKLTCKECKLVNTVLETNSYISSLDHTRRTKRQCRSTAECKISTTPVKALVTSRNSIINSMLKDYLKEMSLAQVLTKICNSEGIRTELDRTVIVITMGRPAQLAIINQIGLTKLTSVTIWIKQAQKCLRA